MGDELKAIVNLFKSRPSTKCITPTDGYREGATD